MRFTVNKQFPLIYAVCKLPKGVVLSLVLTSLLSYGLVNISSAFAIAQPASRGSNIAQAENSNPQAKTLPKRIANAILRDASKRSNLQIRDLQITKVTSKTFGNPCIFKFGEVCTREFKPIEGWEVNVQVRNDSWTYHVDKSGSQIVLDPKVSNSQGNTLPKAIENSILRDASKRSKVPIANLKVTQATQKTFGNPCEFKFGEICTKEFNPIKGWEVVVAVGTQSWTYHVNDSGAQIVLDPKVSATTRS
ncbi:hypothetical protein NUACC21_20930 [Scytonema sp. NUACC21]